MADRDRGISVYTRYKARQGDKYIGYSMTHQGNRMYGCFGFVVKDGCTFWTMVSDYMTLNRARSWMLNHVSLKNGKPERL